MKAGKWWWVSWLETKSPADPRPLHDPPKAKMVARESLQIDRPGRKEFRFFEEVEDAELSDRFPLRPWMRKRIAEQQP